MSLPEPYWTDGERTIHHGDCLRFLRRMERESVSAIVTDPPYGIGFMGKGWDGDLPDPRIWRQCLRVLKPGGFLLAFMSPRFDRLSEFGQHLKRERFDIGYSPIWWVYAQGFPKGADVGKAIDKAEGAERAFGGPTSTIVPNPGTGAVYNFSTDDTRCKQPKAEGSRYAAETIPATPLAQQWDGWRTGHQALKPACEVIVVAQKPMEKGAQWRNVVKHGVGGFNVKGAAVPFAGETLQEFTTPGGGTRGPGFGHKGYADGQWGSTPAGQCGMKKDWGGFIGGYEPPDGIRYRSGGRYPSNLAVSGDALGPTLSRYFSVDAWAREHVTECEDGLVAYCPKAGRREKNEGCEDLPPATGSLTTNNAVQNVLRCQDCGRTHPAGSNHRVSECARCGSSNLELGAPSFDGSGRDAGPLPRNLHPTAKPVALVAWLLTLVCPPDGVALDPFLGSGTTLVAAKQLGLRAIGIELNDSPEEPYCRIASKRVEAAKAPVRTLFDDAGT